MERAPLREVALPESSRSTHSLPLVHGETVMRLPSQPRLNATEDPFTQRRLVGFLGLHFLSFFSELAALINFAYTKDPWFFGLILAPFIFSGIFCAHAAWHCGGQVASSTVLPLKKWWRPLGVLLTVPFGFLQLVIVQLALEEYHLRRGSSERLDTEAGSQMRATSKFHLKAVNGLFEGLLSSAVLLYAFWSMDYPPGDTEKTITHRYWEHEPLFVGLLGIISVLSSGLGLLELDFCISKTISRRMRRSPRYEMLHWIFRTSEVCARLSVFICFMVTMRNYVWWWWVPLAVDFAATILLVLIYGGAERTWLVRLLCSIPCAFANVFMFIDSPYKRGAAKRLSNCLTVKNALALVVLPILVVMGIPAHELQKEFQTNLDAHQVMIVGAGTSIIIYWFLLWWVSSRTMHLNNIVDIYQPCEKGNVASLRSAMRELTHSAAVGLNINCFDTAGQTPLMLAAANGHARVCRLLLQEGARVEVRRIEDPSWLQRCWSGSVKRQWTALHIAAFRGHLEVVQVLMDALRLTGHNADAPESVVEACIDGFKDQRGDTPLHVAARAGHAAVASVIAAARPRWKEVLNDRNQRPVDLALTEEVQHAISDPASAAGGRSSPLLVRQPGCMLTADPSVPVVSAAWPRVQLSIARTYPDGQLMAPGLCSYIASSCGGALGRIFLTDAAALRYDGNGSVLTIISEADESEQSVLRTPRLAPGGASAPASTDQGAPAPNPAMEDLLPIDKERTPIQWWVEMAEQSQRASGAAAGSLAGRRLARVPDETVLGEGSYGLVWRAKNRYTNTWYAVKNIKTRQGTQSVAMRECEVAHHISQWPHPCIVHLFHVQNFTDQGLYVLVMEFCPGGDLLGFIRKSRREARRSGRVYMAPDKALPWIGQIFLGLEHMHLQIDTLLRDLKPENVVLSTSGRAKLTDFGFGRFGVESTGRWSFGIPTGSPGYVAPEVLRKEEYDSRADLYSLGVLVWVLLTGGLVSIQEPQPPVGSRRNPQDFEAHFHDWHRLQSCITNPTANSALPLRSEVAQDFVARLTHRQPNRRMLHADIRAHRFLEPLGLPAYDAPPAAVEEWLERGAASLTPVVDANTTLEPAPEPGTGSIQG